jgi:2,4-diaminopentanoate dehydrogenase
MKKHSLHNYALVMYKVIQWGTGNVGTHALRTIVERNDLQLAGVKVYNEAKRGLDAGELLGRESLGVSCVVELDEILTIDADCVSFNGLGAHDPKAFDRTVDQLCALLRHGFNVTCSALEHLIYPAMMPETLKKLEEACHDGGASFFDTGINPGYTMDFWPVTLTRLSRSIEQIRLLEVVDMKTYDSLMMRSFMGFGLSPGQVTPLDEMHLDWRTSPFYASMLEMADAMGLVIETVRYAREEGLTEHDIEVAVGTFEAGTVVVNKMTYTGVVGGHDFFVHSWVWRTTDDVHAEWGVGDHWECDIVGDPNIHSSLALSTSFDAGRPVSLTVATLNVNAIPTLCDAPPGVYTNLTLPNFAGGYRTVDGLPVSLG